MSHFSVLVISDNTNSVDDLMAPYCEHDEYYFVFENKEDESRNEYENETVSAVRMPNGSIKFLYDEEFRVEGTIGSGKDTHRLPEELKEEDIPLKEIYKTFGEFCRKYLCHEFDEDEQAWGYYHNPQSKWDYWSERYYLTLKEPREVPLDIEGLDDPYRDTRSALVKDLDFSVDENVVKLRKKQYDLLSTPVDEIEKQGKGIERINAFFAGKAVFDNCGSKEEFVSILSKFHTWAVVTPDGEWHEPGTMGWFGCSSGKPEDEYVWMRDYYKNWIESANPKWTFTTLDCHI